MLKHEILLEASLMKNVTQTSQSNTQISRSNESPVENPPVGNFCLNDYCLQSKTPPGFCLMQYLLISYYVQSEN